MTDRINSFIETHPNGWNHTQWLDLLAELGQEGMDVSEPDVVGLELGRGRMAWALRLHEVQGLGPKRVQALVDTYTTFWSLRQASCHTVFAFLVGWTVPKANAGLPSQVMAQ